MRETIAFALELDLDVALFSVATPYPGTELYEWAQRNGYITTRDWEEYDRAHTVLHLPTVDPETVWRHHRMAYRRFYLDPVRIARILKAYPKPHYLPYYLPLLIKTGTKGLVREILPGRKAAPRSAESK